MKLLETEVGRESAVLTSSSAFQVDTSMPLDWSQVKLGVWEEQLSIPVGQTPSRQSFPD